MNEVEARLERYRPAGPPEDLRARVIAGAMRAPAMRVRDWLPAAAAVLVAALFYWLAANERQLIAARVPPMTDDAVITIPVEPWP